MSAFEHYKLKEKNNAWRRRSDPSTTMEKEELKKDHEAFLLFLAELDPLSLARAKEMMEAGVSDVDVFDNLTSAGASGTCVRVCVARRVGGSSWVGDRVE